MGIFKKDKTTDWSKIADFDELQPTADYGSVLTWLVGLSNADFKTVIKVATIYRKADKEAAVERGIDIEPSSYIDPPEPSQPETSLDNEPNWLYDEDLPKSKKGTK